MRIVRSSGLTGAASALRPFVLGERACIGAPSFRVRRRVRGSDAGIRRLSALELLRSKISSGLAGTCSSTSCHAIRRSPKSSPGT